MDNQRSIPRVDVPAKVTGRALYADDLFFPGMLYTKTVRCPHPHAEILDIDASEALKAEGVVGVFTARDIPGVNGKLKEKPILADRFVKSAGDGVAVVAAETLRAAKEGADKVRVRYEALEGISDPIEALKDEGVIVHGDTNLACVHKIKKGDIESGFAEADVVIERSYSTQRIQHAALETDSAVVVPEGDGITVYCPCKGPYSVRLGVAAACGLEPEKVRLIQPAIGGSFGGKQSDSILIASRAAAVAMKTGRPCKMTWDREESFLEGTKRHPFHLTYKIGATRSGRITALKIRGTADAGAYLSVSRGVVWRASVEAAGPYDIPNVSTEISGAFTNNVYSDAVRGYGSPQVDFAMESLMDELAYELKINPIELRRINGFREGSVSATSQVMRNVGLRQCLDQLEKVFDTRNLPGDIKDGKAAGKGVACLFRGESYGAANPNKDVCGLDLTVQPDGRIKVSSSISEVGQGSHTIPLFVVSEILGIPPEDITVEPVDTAFVPDGGVTAGSRGTISIGNASGIAAGEVKERIAARAAEALGTVPEMVRFRDGKVFPDQAPENFLSFKDAVSLCLNKGDGLTAHGLWTAPKTAWDFENQHGDTYHSYCYGASGAEVEIDLVTGKIDVKKLIFVEDVGRIYNLEEIKAQITGGLAMSLGFTLLEEVPAQEGNISTTNYDRYLLPGAMDFESLEAVALEEIPAGNPLGVHGVGEAATAIVAPAIANAVFNALGVRIRDLPISLEKMKEAIMSKQQEGGACNEH